VRGCRGGAAQLRAGGLWAMDVALDDGGEFPGPGGGMRRWGGDGRVLVECWTLRGGLTSPVLPRLIVLSYRGKEGNRYNWLLSLQSLGGPDTAVFANTVRSGKHPGPNQPKKHKRGPRHKRKRGKKITPPPTQTKKKPQNHPHPKHPSSRIPSSATLIPSLQTPPSSLQFLNAAENEYTLSCPWKICVAESQTWKHSASM